MVDVVKHSVLVDEHMVVEVEVTNVWQSVVQVVIEVVSQIVIVEEHRVVEVDVTIV